MTAPSYQQLTQTLSSNLAPLRKTQADVMKGFSDTSKAAMAGGPMATYAANAVAAFQEFTEPVPAQARSRPIRCDRNGW